MAKITERGWGGHFICANRCRFRRNTLIEGDSDRIVVSTVGAMESLDCLTYSTVIHGEKMEIIGYNIGYKGRYYETMAFGAMNTKHYIEADVSDQRMFSSEWAICANSVEELPDDVDNVANEMHERVVREIASSIR